MDESLSHRFITALEPHRDRLYADALALAKSPAAAEGLLQQVLRAQFQGYAEGRISGDVAVQIRRELVAAGGGAAEGSTAPGAGGQPMPAATWARLAAGVQLEAAKSGAAKALKPDSVLLTPDPLLAAKKHAVPSEPMDGLRLSPVSRFVLGVTVALIVGISLSLYFCTRTTPSAATRAATRPASTRTGG